MMRRALLAVSLSALCVACGSSDEASAALGNPVFERWCNAHPCDWDVDGEARRVGTWHPDDFAVELVSDGSSLSQLRAELEETRAKCFDFSLMAQLSGDARAYLELDFLDDGEVEFSEPIPASNWEVRTFTITTPTWYRGVRFKVRKQSGSRVIVAELNVELEPYVCHGTPLPLNDRPLGAKCDLAEECRSGSCSPSTVSTALPALTKSPGGTCD